MGNRDLQVDLIEHQSSLSLNFVDPAAFEKDKNETDYDNCVIAPKDET